MSPPKNYRNSSGIIPVHDPSAANNDQDDDIEVELHTDEETGPSLPRLWTDSPEQSNKRIYKVVCGMTGVFTVVLVIVLVLSLTVSFLIFNDDGSIVTSSDSQQPSNSNTDTTVALTAFESLDYGNCDTCGTNPTFTHDHSALISSILNGRSVQYGWKAVPEEPLCIIIDPVNKEYVRVFGRVYQYKKSNQEVIEDAELYVNFTLSNKEMFDECYCAVASKYLKNDDIQEPKYDKIEDECTLHDYIENAEEGQLYCPKCEKGQCKKANTERNKMNGAPKPIWEEWYFYDNIAGTLEGPGLKLFRETVKKSHPEVEDNLTQCTLDITDKPLPQMYCTDLDNVEESFGYGVNAKNQKCGLSFWFNCEEDLQFIADKSTGRIDTHTGDVNIEFTPCPSTTSNPTLSPSLAPTGITNTPTKTPTSAPTGCDQSEQCTNVDGLCVSPDECESDQTFDQTLCSDPSDPNCGCCFGTNSPTLRPTITPTTAPTGCDQSEQCTNVDGLCVSPDECESDQTFDQTLCSDPSDPNCGCCFSTSSPSLRPTIPNIKTPAPTRIFTPTPSNSPTLQPVFTPEPTPTSLTPSNSPTRKPTISPTRTPTISPTDWPTASPTRTPTISPTDWPTASPTSTPTISPSTSPSLRTYTPTYKPTTSGPTTPEPTTPEPTTPEPTTPEPTTPEPTTPEPTTPEPTTPEPTTPEPTTPEPTTPEPTTPEPTTPEPTTPEPTIPNNKTPAPTRSFTPKPTKSPSPSEPGWKKGRG